MHWLKGQTSLQEASLIIVFFLSDWPAGGDEQGQGSEAETETAGTGPETAQSEQHGQRWDWKFRLIVLFNLSNAYNLNCLHSVALCMNTAYKRFVCFSFQLVLDTCKATFQDAGFAYDDYNLELENLMQRSDNSAGVLSHAFWFLRFDE